MSETKITQEGTKKQDEVAGDIKGIEHIRDRLKWIHNSPLSCDMDTVGECKAFIDAVHAVVATEIDVLGDLIGDLKNLLGLNEKGGAA